MTVKELIKMLKEYDPDQEVFIGTRDQHALPITEVEEATVRRFAEEVYKVLTGDESGSWTEEQRERHATEVGEPELYPIIIHDGRTRV